MATLPDSTLMQRAADGLAEVLEPLVFGSPRTRPTSKDVLVLVGTGDNGGDALYAAARLASQGARVDLLLTDVDRAHSAGLRAATAAGATVVDRPDDARPDVVVDGLVGIGGRPGLREPATGWYEQLRASGAYVVAVDVPSGVDVDGGTLPATHMAADLTCTFGTYKPALFLDPAASAAGPQPATLVDIGLQPYLGDPDIECIDAGDAHLLRSVLQPLFADGTHKYSRGVVGVAAGSGQFAGAAELCVLGAQA